MLSPYGMEMVDSCLTCKLRAERIFCDLPPAALQNFENIKYTTAYPQGAVLFVEGQMPRGIFVLCKGTVKLSINSPGGRTMIVKLAEPGEVLGLSATISGKPYEMTAETIDPCQVNFVKRDDFLHFLKDDVEACFKVAEQLSEKYHNACDEVRSLGLSHSAAEKLAKLLLEWSCKNGESWQGGATLDAETDSRGNRANDRDLARDGHPVVCRHEEAPDRTVERLDAGHSRHGCVARDRKSQLGPPMVATKAGGRTNLRTHAGRVGLNLTSNITKT